uniref:Uncharacterized protein n=1 Tax=Vitis vinifera TaxID=29760 RepID=A5BC03_VITVI|nr:hypothetical protein VITISV_037606 [Vitis vinifera]
MVHASSPWFMRPALMDSPWFMRPALMDSPQRGSPIPSPTSEAHEFHVLQVLYKYLAKKRLDRFMKNRMVCPVRRFDRWFERFNAGSTIKRFIETDRTGKLTGRRLDRSDRPVRSGF